MLNSELHKAAIELATAGIPVFPVEVNGKKPVTPNGFYDATTDLAQIADWWGRADYNVAFSPGTVGLFVVDTDPGAELPRELTPTYTVKTPRGGNHFYYEGEGPTTASKVGNHVDTRGEGGYVLVPPSVVNGQRYTLAKSLPYAPIDEWVLEAIKKPETAVAASVEEKDLPINIERATEVLQNHVKNGNTAVQGQGGDDLTYRICCEILDFGLTPETALAIILDHWNGHCQPPWTEQELNIKLNNAAEYQQNEAGAYAIEPPQDVFGSVVAKLFPEKKSRFHFKDEEEQDNEPEPQWIIKDLISERSTVLLYGPTQSYKSFIALQTALAIATGTDAYGSKTLAGKVFYCALEGKAHLKKARRSWRLAHSWDGSIHNFYLGLAPLIAVDTEIQEFGDEIRKRCKEETPRLIIIDTLTKSMAGLNENDAGEAGQFIQFCDSLVEEFGCSVIAIHHTGKDKERGARGSSAFQAGFDTVIEVTAHRENKAVEVKVIKHKDAEERAAPWTFEGRVVGPSLAFFETTPKEHKALTDSQSEYSARKIGAALQKLGAYGQENAVTVSVLASTLIEPIEGRSIEDHQEVVSRAQRILFKAGKGYLEQYTYRNGKQTLWALPEPIKR